MKHTTYLIIAITMVLTGRTEAKVDLVTLPTRDTVQLTIYNSADLTLARESRQLTLTEGANKLQFSWANTLIDPTSLEMLPLGQADKIDIAELVFPPRVRELGLWNVNSGVSGRVPVEISYLTSGLSWRAFYMGTLSEDEKMMRLQGYVRVSNNSGEDYENAQTRLIVGKVNVLDEIAALARREHAYGRPGPQPKHQPRSMRGAKARVLDSIVGYEGDMIAMGAALEKPKEIRKEGLSEYFLYTIEGTETIRNGWSKRLGSFTAEEVPVVNLYKYEQQRYGDSVVRFLSFKNDDEHKLGETPIPGGKLKVYRLADSAGHLGYEGQSDFKYIPVDDEVELNIGAVSNVVVEPKVMDYRTENYEFDSMGRISGWDEIRTFKIEVKNTRELPVKVEIKRNFGTSYWELVRSDDVGEYEKVDKDTVKFTLELAGRGNNEFGYVLTTYHGSRENR